MTFIVTFLCIAGGLRSADRASVRLTWVDNLDGGDRRARLARAIHRRLQKSIELFGSG
jgi:hypothetical protein